LFFSDSGTQETPLMLKSRSAGRPWEILDIIQEPLRVLRYTCLECLLSSTARSLPARSEGTHILNKERKDWQ